jgi:hypothetical protein
MRMKLAAGAGVLAMVLASSPAHADSFSAFAGTWDGMRNQVVIDASGGGHFTYFGNCPSCSMANMPRETANFTLNSVSGNTASGTVTSDTGGGAPGWPMSVTLANQFGGQTINLNAGKASGLYCSQAIASQCGG